MKQDHETTSVPKLCSNLATTQFLAHGLNDRRVIGFAKNGTAGHKGVGAGIGHTADVVHLDAAIHLEANVFA